MFLRVFRFDAKDDYEFYYKPYKIAANSEQSILSALLECAKQDRYFACASEDFYLKIGHKIVHTSEKLSDFKEYFDGDELYLHPLSQKHAKCDFTMDSREFMGVYDECFAPIFGESERANYAALEFLFYATPAREIVGEFIGDSALVFAARMMKRHPECTEALKRVVFSEFGLAYAQDLRPFLHRDAQIFEREKDFLKALK